MPDDITTRPQRWPDLAVGAYFYHDPEKLAAESATPPQPIQYYKKIQPAGVPPKAVKIGGPEDGVVVDFWEFADCTQVEFDAVAKV